MTTLQSSADSHPSSILPLSTPKTPLMSCIIGRLREGRVWFDPADPDPRVRRSVRGLCKKVPADVQLGAFGLRHLRNVEILVVEPGGGARSLGVKAVVMVNPEKDFNRKWSIAHDCIEGSELYRSLQATMAQPCAGAFTTQ